MLVFCTQRPYRRGSSISKAGTGVSPLPWDMTCPPAVNFCDSVTHYDVPFTSRIKRCDECHGRQRIRCDECNGEGHTECGHCGGKGKIIVSHGEDEERLEPCSPCHGRGQVTCEFRDCRGEKCHGGLIWCPQCTGFGQVGNGKEEHIQHTNARYLFRTCLQPPLLQLLLSIGSLFCCHYCAAPFGHFVSLGVRDVRLDGKVSPDDSAPGNSRELPHRGPDSR